MIGFVPIPYPDELLYSVLARYYAKSGYVNNRNAANDIYVNFKVHPNIDFLNAYTGNFINLLARHNAVDDIILNHTMFPYFARFVDYKRRIEAFKSLTQFKDGIRNILPIVETKTDRRLRCCPMCVADDYDKYGETYWHRVHQLIGVDNCIVHKVKLRNTDAKYDSRYAPILIDANKCISSFDAVNCENNIELKLNEYMVRLFQLPIFFDNCITISEYLNRQLEYTQYSSIRGYCKDNVKLVADISDYYGALSTLTVNRLQDIITGHRINYYEICLICCFLGITVGDLSQLNVSNQSKVELYDKLIVSYRNDGFTYEHIAKLIGGSSGYIRKRNAKLMVT